MVRQWLKTFSSAKIMLDSLVLNSIQQSVLQNITRRIESGRMFLPEVSQSILTSSRLVYIKRSRNINLERDNYQFRSAAFEVSVQH